MSIDDATGLELEASGAIGEFCRWACAGDVRVLRITDVDVMEAGTRLEPHLPPRKRQVLAMLSVLIEKSKTFWET